MDIDQAAHHTERTEHEKDKPQQYHHWRVGRKIGDTAVSELPYTVRVEIKGKG